MITDPRRMLAAPTPPMMLAARSVVQRKYKVILADPPWKYRVWGKPSPDGRSAESHYSTMETADIKDLPIGDLADKDCCLLMWVTWPTIDQAFEVAKAWGFEYKTCAFLWAKLNKAMSGRFTMLDDDANWFCGLGFWTRANTEACLLFTRGNPRRVNNDVRQLIVSPLREHSRKPDEQYSLIERLVDGPYVELFARRKWSDKWHVWGNEVEPDIQLPVARELAIVDTPTAADARGGE